MFQFFATPPFSDFLNINFLYQRTNDGINIALGKPASQSSTDHGGDASKAVDGNRDGNFGAGSVTHTDHFGSEWWEVDLQEDFTITRIDIYNRRDCCKERLAFSLLVLEDTAGNEIGGTTRELNAEDKQELSFAYQSGVRRVRVFNRLDGSQGFSGYLENLGIISLAEVEVYGFPEVPRVVSPKPRGVQLPPVICSNNAHVTGILTFVETNIGITNMEITCSDRTVLWTTNNFSGEKTTLLSCSQGFDSAAPVGIVHPSGVNQGLYNVQAIETSCDDDQSRHRSSDFDDLIAALSPEVSCTVDQVVIGIQVEELDDSDGGLVRFRLACNKKANLAAFIFN